MKRLLRGAVSAPLAIAIIALAEPAQGSANQPAGARVGHLGVHRHRHRHQRHHRARASTAQSPMLCVEAEAGQPGEVCWNASPEELEWVEREPLWTPPYEGELPA